MSPIPVNLQHVHTDGGALRCCSNGCMDPGLVQTLAPRHAQYLTTGDALDSCTAAVAPTADGSTNTLLPYAPHTAADAR